MRTVDEALAQNRRARPAVRPAIAAMQGYTPGEQPRIGSRIVKLNTNENPYPPSPRVLDVIHSVDGEALRRYPSPNADLFRETAARLVGVTPAHVLAGNGSDDILSIALRTLCDPGDRLAMPDPTYSLYPVLAQLNGTRTEVVPWRSGYQLPVEELLAAKPRAVFFANPNAPTGSLVSAADVRRLADALDGFVLVDEAYIDFAPAGSDCVALLASCENLIISRTLSKSYALAGLRFGYALANPWLIREMQKVKDSYNCDAISILAATAALEDQEYARGTWTAILRERERLHGALETTGWSVTPSHANFLLARPPQGDGARIYRELKARGILVRHFALPGLDEWVRISVGSPAETDDLLAALAAIG